MKRLLVLITSIAMAASLAACSPTKTEGEKRTAPPAGAEQQETVDGLSEKVPDSNAAPSVTVCVYSIKEDQTGLKQNMDAVDGEELDAQMLIDKMAEIGVIEEGIQVLSFEKTETGINLNLSAFEKSGDSLVLTALANTFLQNYELDDGELTLSINGTKLDKTLTFNKNYKTMGK